MFKSLYIFSLVLGTTFASGQDCSLDIIRGKALDYPPIVTDEMLDFILPQGTEYDRSIPLTNGQVIVLGCPGTEFDHETSWNDGPVYARCDGGERLAVWTDTEKEVSLQWRDMSCRQQPMDNVDVVGNCGPDGESTLIQIGFQMYEGDTDPTNDARTILVCHNLKLSSTLWARHSLWDEISAGDHGNDRPYFNPDNFFDYDVNQAYTRDDQISAVAELVGSYNLAIEYIEEEYGGDLYMARGHLAPNADFLFYSLMDSSFHFINVAPQWQCFNGGNWMYFEWGVRDFVIERAIDAVVYTGTHGVMELEDVNGNMVDIYLHNKNMLPVPKFYWKIVHDPEAGQGVAVIGVNNPHVKNVSEYILCPPLDNPSILSSVHHPDNVSKGYMYACRVEDLVAVVPEVPRLPSMDLLD